MQSSVTAADNTEDLEYPAAKLGRIQTTALIMAVVGLVLFGIGAVMNPKGFWHSYLYAFLFWFGVSAGSLGLLLLHHMVSGGWGFLIRRQLEAAAGLMWLLAILFFVPMVLGGLHNMYEWTHPGATSHGLLAKKAAWLNEPGFYIRSAIYFILWFVLARTLIRWGNTHDERNDPRVTNRLNHLGSGGMILMVLSMTFAMVDWVMSLTPEWTSSIIGLLFSATHTLSAMSVMLVLFNFLHGDRPLLATVPRKYFRDLGNLLLALVMLWAYLSFSQFLIIYSGNIAEEAFWYRDRREGGWGIISLALIPLHFALPFLVLLVGSGLKRSPKRLAGVALFLIVMRHLDLFWWVAPTFRDNLYFTPADFGATLLIGGIWLWLWAGALRGRRVLPLHDPRLEGQWPVPAAHH